MLSGEGMKFADPDPAAKHGPVTQSTSARRGRPRADAATRRRRILDAAFTVFSERGFSESTIEAIALTAGVTKRTIYETVGEKEAVFRAVCCDSLASASRLVIAPLPQNAGIHDALATIAHTLLGHATSPGRVAISRMIMLESTRFPDLAKDVLETGRESVDHAIIAVLKQLEDRGAVHISDHSMAAKLFYDVVIGNLAFRITLGFGSEAMSEAELDQRLRLFVRGYFHPTGD